MPNINWAEIYTLPIFEQIPAIKKLVNLDPELLLDIELSKWIQLRNSEIIAWHIFQDFENLKDSFLN